MAYAHAAQAASHHQPPPGMRYGSIEITTHRHPTRNKLAKTMPACWPARIALPWGPWPSPATPAAAGRVSRICKISCRMHSFTGPQPLLTCEWRDAYLETSVGYDTHRTLGTSNDASYIRLMPLTGSKNRFSAPNGSQNGAG